jgi:uncharacterized protein (TIGR03083 family)
MSDGLLTTADGFRAGYRDTLGSVDWLVGALAEERWGLPTGCPGWSVRDCVAHIAGLESILIGRPIPEHALAGEFPHIRNEPGRFMEVLIDYRRAWPVAGVLADFREVIAIRLAALDKITDDDLERDTRGFFGMLKLRNSLTIRVFDIWSHEQDIRRALAEPGGLDGPAAGHSRERMLRGVAAKVQEDLAPAAGTTLDFDITGSGGATRAIEFDGDRGRVVAEAPPSPTASLRLDLATLTVLACGRADDPGARGRVAVTGDAELAALVLDGMAITP